MKVFNLCLASQPVFLVANQVAFAPQYNPETRYPKVGPHEAAENALSAFYVRFDAAVSYTGQP